MKKLLCAVFAVAIAAGTMTVPVSAAWERDASGIWRYEQADGALSTGWQKIGDCWYFFSGQGEMYTGWQFLGEDWYYFYPSGAMAAGWVQTGGKWYFLGSDGKMRTGFVHDGNCWYFLDESGAWTEDDPESRTAVTKTGKTASLKNGMFYVDGILIANKSYPLPSDYAPGGLTGETQRAFSELQNAMAAEGLSLWVASGYRSYDYQAGLYRKYVNRDGKAAADRYSARAGYSEHQTGLAFDVNQVNDSFANTPQAKWLAEHAWEYGFIIRYPKGKEGVTGYQYEPWHLRYLGKETAKAVQDSGLCLEEYLGIDSVYARN